METTYSIAEISERTGLNYDTIRYYVKIGLLPPGERKENGKREYGKVHLDRLMFIHHLKRTQMPLKEIRRYLTVASERNYELCYDVLHDQMLRIESQMTELQETWQLLADKLEHYKDVIKHTEIGEIKLEG